MTTPSLPQLNKANLAVHHAATKGESRYALNCVLVNGVGTVATDGRCLAEVSYPAKPDAERERELLLRTLRAGAAAMLRAAPA